jgi:hypothetical protein
MSSSQLVEGQMCKHKTLGKVGVIVALSHNSKHASVQWNGERRLKSEKLSELVPIQKVK